MDATYAVDHEGDRSRLRAVHEHGQEWVTCLDCGAAWAVDGSHAELVNEGDGSCEGGEVSP